MVEKLGSPDSSGHEHKHAAHRRRVRGFTLLLWGTAAIFASAIVAAAVETRTSYVQALLLSRIAKTLTYDVKPGPSDNIAFPRGGPDDKRKGYSALPSFLSALTRHQYEIVRQAAWSPDLRKFTDYSGYAIYHEKRDAGLALIDRSGESLYRARYPERTYEDFRSVPPLIVSTLRFIEDRALLDSNTPNRDPAINWRRLTLASMGLVGGMVDSRLKRGGGSTLATQIEKFRHYPDGLTRDVGDKFGQMFSAATRSYLDGPETLGAQQRIIYTYLNLTPLGARPSYGEVIGIGDGLWAWYGTDFDEANRALSGTGAATPQRGAEIYKQALSLLLAQRRPSYYLSQDRDALRALTDTYLRLLAKDGVIDDTLFVDALRAPLTVIPEPPSAPAASFVARKAATSVQTELLRMLGTSSLYDLDRLDLTARTTFDAPVQSRVGNVMAKLGDRKEAQTLGLVGPRLLGTEDPSRVAYSLVVYERQADRNVLRVRADSVNQPFDLNSGSKLILGSTAKLRTLVTYLGIITRLHAAYEKMPVRQLFAAADAAKDPLTQWAAAYLAQARDRSLQSMLDAAMQRQYSASPAGSFFTGGGIHVFQNYERSDNGKRPTVEQALVNSINLAFIRVMRDVRDYYIAQDALSDGKDDLNLGDMRQRYLERFADEEGSTYLTRFYDEFHGLSADQMLSQFADRSRTPKRLTIVFRSVRPQAVVSELRAYLARELPNISLSDQETQDLYEQFGPDRFSLSDRAYLAGTHPLRIWLASYLRQRPNATLGQVLAASQDQRQAAYDWLFKTRHPRAQDQRIRIIREQDAFEQILQDWRNQGYPFAHLVPSLATAIGSSGDRPDALAQLMGIILNDGVLLPSVSIEHLSFAAGTPYETELAFAAEQPRRVMAPEIAITVRRALANVVAKGTGISLRGTFVAPGGGLLPIGGKTGTGDNRYKVFGPGHALMESRAVDRTATFVFYLGDRFFGTVTAYVGGEEAGNYHFSSALALRLLKGLAPDLKPLIDTGAPMANTAQAASQQGQISLVAHKSETAATR